MLRLRHRLRFPLSRVDFVKQYERGINQLPLTCLNEAVDFVVCTHCSVPSVDSEDQNDASKMQRYNHDTSRVIQSYLDDNSKIVQ